MSHGPAIVTLLSPNKLVFGIGCAQQFVDDLITAGRRRVFAICSPVTATLLRPLVADKPLDVTIFDDVQLEPTVAKFEETLASARKAKPDVIVGFGGGSPMDVAKLVAALYDGKQNVADTFGIGKLAGRSLPLICLPTTAGTGSEVSPNAILLDEAAELKKGVVSPFLVPDAAYVDPLLTLGVPAAVTAATGVDALTHCIEAYANKLAHPMIDPLALEGIRLISTNLRTAVADGQNVAARTAVALGSMYGGMCLGPVNTGAVHALAYPLGGEFHVAHGVSNSLLLPHVLKFNLPAAPKRYCQIAAALGVIETGSDHHVAELGLRKIESLSSDCGIPKSLRDFKIPHDAIPRLAKSAMTVTRLLDRNVREVTEADAIRIYEQAFSCPRFATPPSSSSPCSRRSNRTAPSTP
ncbi:MAG: iron-containing alcohol dehydrogenase, partial [Phycisphaerales bacterium]|nr:iron-containing alcohol dehydrogenase [Phycisphaerales bacterium]